MDINNADINHITEMLEALSEDNLSTIDFDNHRQWMTSLAERLPRLLQIENDLAILRADYEGRIAGMAKAVAAVNRNSEALKQAVSFIEALPQMDAADLVQQYRIMSARFRDAFPASFGHIPTLMKSAGSTSGKQTYHTT
ncbi:MAG: hypothetical protein U9N55_03770 [candidate division Zixibacteria bacterium]|nr:hypothetical protein [candidate division Zixibacteria bacterium]